MTHHQPSPAAPAPATAPTPAAPSVPATPHVGRHSAAFPLLNTPSTDFDIPDLSFPTLRFGDGGERKEQ